MGLDNVFVNWTSGIDTNPGTIGSPVKTNSKAATLVNPDGTIHNRGGDQYFSSAIASVPSGSGGGNYTKIAPYEDEVVTWKALNTLSTGFFSLTEGVDYIWWDHIKCDGVGEDVWYALRLGGTIAVPNVGMKVTNFETMRIGEPILSQTITDSLFQNLWLHSPRTDLPVKHAFYMSGNSINNVVEDFIFDGFDIGVHNYSTSNNPASNTWRRGIVRNCSSTGVILWNADNLRAENLIVYNCGGVGIHSKGGDGHELYFCSVYNCNSGTAGFLVDSSSTNVTVRNILSLEHFTANYVNNSPSKTESNLITSGLASTYFADAPNGDFSPLVTGNGVAVSGITVDQLGTTRPDPPTIGALEAEGASTAPENVIPTSRTTMVSVNFSFSEFDVTSDNLDQVEIYAEDAGFV